LRRVPAAIGILVILLFGAAPAFAASPAGHASPGSPPGLAGRQVGNSPTWHLTDGAMVHIHKTRNAPSSHAPIPPYQGTPPVLYWGGPIVPSEHVVSIYWAASTIYAGGPTPGTTGVAGGDGSLVGYFLSHLGGSNYYNTNTTYYDTVGGGHTVANTLSYTGFWADNASPPSGSTYVSDASVMNEIISGFNSGKITYDASTVYAVFSSGSVNLGGGFGTQYCAYHGDFSWNGHIVLYAVMPYNYAAGFSCFTGNAPNGDAPADAEVNTLAHELEEANTDPQLNAWFDSPNGYEDADECAWIFGNAGLSGGQANITVGAKNFYVQEEWLQVPNGGQCVQGYAPGAPTAPAAPTLNSATAGVNSVSLSWSAGSNGGANITNFSIYRSTTPGAEGTTAYATVGNVTGYTDNGASAGVTYYYTVAATNSVGTGPQSNERSATPNAPPTVPGAPTLNSATGGTNSVVLSWSAPASNGGASITGYAVYRSTTAGGEGTTAFATVGNVTTYTDSTASVGTTYYYKVAATNSVGTGALSGERSATPTAASVPGASTLTASKATGRNRGVQLSWTAAAPNGSAISGYSIYRSTSSTGTFTFVKTVSASIRSYLDASTTSGQRYYYYVFATNGVGPGPHSNTATAIAR
jgi:fibronectin type 3 domain-containing protein